MFVGHSMLAFALAGALARAAGVTRERAFLVGAAAALFAVVPDLDVVFAVGGLASADPLDGFWAASRPVHRGPTHSIVLGATAALAAAAWASDHSRARSSVVLVACVAVSSAFGGVTWALVMAAFWLGIVAAAVLARQAGLEPRETFGAALVALASHPFGDLFTGGPPALLWPLPIEVFHARIAPFADGTLDFLLAFGVELAAIWVGILAIVWLLDHDPHRTLREHVRPQALLGVIYVGSIFVFHRPTNDLPYAFFLSIVPLGALGLQRPLQLRTREWLLTATLTGLSTVTVAWFSYTVAHVLTSP